MTGVVHTTGGGGGVVREEKDRSAKWLLEHHGDAVLRLSGVRDFTSWRAVQPELVHPRQLPDGLLEVRFPGRPAPGLYVVEVATYPERRAEDEVARDAMLVFLDRGVVPEVITVVLAPRGNLRITGEWDKDSPEATTRLTCRSRVVELWMLSAEDLLAAGDVGLVPFVPLAHATEAPDVLLRRCREYIDREAPPAERPNLLAVAQVLARLRYNDPGLLGLLGGIQPMIESPAFDDLREYIRGEMCRKHILDNLSARFGTVPEDMASRVRAMQDNDRLEELHRFSAVCPDLEAFRARLAS
jgi:hypothetical protein